tara:strand:- start:4549 stop:4761 length:213 start_codon:yes stop_codon:yes gene_type:complete
MIKMGFSGEEGSVIHREVGGVVLVYVATPNEPRKLISDVCVIQSNGDMRVTSFNVAKTQGVPIVGRIKNW